MRYVEAISLLAGIVEQAQMDAKGTHKSYVTDYSYGVRTHGRAGWIPARCNATIRTHRAMVCADEFLTKIDEFLREVPEPTASDLAQAILEVIG